MGTNQFILLSALICYTTEASYSKTGLVLLRNKRNVKSRAELRSCARHNCSNLSCSNDDGWQLFGSDWGCCGNYDGCCKWASVVCYAHDVICQCCDYGWWCGPECRPEPECFLPGRKIFDHSFVNEIPRYIPQNGYARNMNGSGNKIFQEDRKNTGQSNTIPKEGITFKNNNDRTSETGHQKEKTIESTENINDKKEQLSKNETQNNLYAQNITQKSNYSNFQHNEGNNSSFIKSVDSTFEGSDAGDNYTENVINDSMNDTTITDPHNKTKLPWSIFDRFNTSGEIAKQSDRGVRNNSLETIEEMEDVYENETRATNITGLDNEFNSTTTQNQTVNDNSVTEKSNSEMVGNDRSGETDYEDAFQNVIYVARMSSSSSEVPDPDRDSAVEEDGSGAL